MLRITAIGTMLMAVLGTQAQNFAGQVFQLAESYSERTCTTDAECDCCSNDLIFLSATQFALIGRCLYNDSYYKGRYEVKSNTLTLSFEPTVVDEIMDEQTMKVENKKATRKLAPLHYMISSCGGNKIKLQGSFDNDFKYGSRFEKIREAQILGELKKRPAWKILSSSTKP